MTESHHIPPMPDGFTDRAAWDAIHWKPSTNGSHIDEAVIAWQRDNQDRCKAAADAEVASLQQKEPHNGS